jgi:small subunit ribosomal protein S16
LVNPLFHLWKAEAFKTKKNILKMSTKIRLQRHGRKGQPYYQIVVADSRAKRDGKFIEKLGFYNPTSIPATIEIDRDRALDWLLTGAQPTDTVKAILKYKGVLFKKHLKRGVDKGAFTAEEAEAKFQAWLGDKEAKVSDKKDAQTQKVASIVKATVEAGKEKAAAKLKAKLEGPAVVEEETAEEVVEDVTEATEEVVAEAEVSEEVVAETAAEEVVAEATTEEPTADEASEEEKA